MDRFSQMALSAARMAEADSGISIVAEPGPGRRGGRDRDRRTRRVRGLLPGRCSSEAPIASSPFAIVQIIPNMAAAWVSMELGTQGPLAAECDGLRGVEHGDRRRPRRDPARPRGRDVLRRYRGARSPASGSPASTRCARSRSGTTTRRRRRGRSTPTVTASSWARPARCSCSRSSSMLASAARRSTPRCSATASPRMRVTSPSRTRPARTLRAR